MLQITNLTIASRGKAVHLLNAAMVNKKRKRPESNSRQL
jgi:hypothetical protein